MAQQTINIGAIPNDGSGDPLRTAFTKINSNFTELYASDFATVLTYTVGSTPNQVIFETPAATFTQGSFQINSSNPSTNNSQNISINVAKSNDGLSVNSAMYANILIGTAITTYSVDYDSGNVRILSSPLTGSLLNHFVSYQLMYASPSLPGLDLQLDGYVDSVLATEDGLILTTE